MADSTPFTREAPVTLEMMASPMSRSPKNSAGPNMSATAASGSAARISTRSLKVSPMVEE